MRKTVSVVQLLSESVTPVSWKVSRYWDDRPAKF